MPKITVPISEASHENLRELSYITKDSINEIVRGLLEKYLPDMLKRARKEKEEKESKE